MQRWTRWLLTTGLLLGVAGAAQAEPVRNGNEMAMKFQRGDAAVKGQIRQARTGLIHVWRYLKITALSTDANTGAVTLRTVEPSSDFEVVLVTGKPLSKKLAAGLQVGDCVAARGRVASIAMEQPNRIVVDPCVLEYKDRATPAAGKELLSEVDPRAY